jgi:hypothetical protein
VPDSLTLPPLSTHILSAFLMVVSLCATTTVVRLCIDHLFLLPFSFVTLRCTHSTASVLFFSMFTTFTYTKYNRPGSKCNSCDVAMIYKHAAVRHLCNTIT